MGKDIKSYLDSLRNEKFRSIIIYHTSQAELNSFLKKLAEKISAKHIDLLSLFTEDQELCNQLDRYSVSDLNQLIQKHTINEEQTVITDIGFIWDTWDTEERKAFISLVRNQWNSYYKETHSGLIFGLPEESMLKENTINDNKGENRILSLNQINAL